MRPGPWIVQHEFAMHELTKEEKENHHMSTNLTAVLQEVLQNTTNLEVLRQLMTPDATYVSLSFDNPELKKVMPGPAPTRGHRRCPMSLGNPTLLEDTRLQGHRRH
jgi:hypothetical protein